MLYLFTSLLNLLDMSLLLVHLAYLWILPKRTVLMASSILCSFSWNFATARQHQMFFFGTQSDKKLLSCKNRPGERIENKTRKWKRIMNYLLPTIGENKKKTRERLCTAVLKDMIRLDIRGLARWKIHFLRRQRFIWDPLGYASPVMLYYLFCEINIKT